MTDIDGPTFVKGDNNLSQYYTHLGITLRENKN